MSKNKIKKHWRKLDNTAKMFSLDDRNNTSTFRYSVLLKKEVDPKILQKAVNKALEDCPSFKVKQGSGLFWNYIETNDKEIKIEKENEIPCQHINLRKNNKYLFKVTYYKNKINLDIFHILSDGIGASVFLKAILYNYLNLKYKLKYNIEKEEEIKNYQDLYLKYVNKSLKDNEKKEPAYQLPGIPHKNINNTYHYIVSVKELKKICKKHGVTITEYITALYINSIYTALYNKKSKKEIIISIPINLRSIYNEFTIANFFTYMKVKSSVVGKDKVTFNEILEFTHKEFKEKLTKDKVEKYLARDVRIGTNIFIRLAPLFMKKLFIKYFGFSVKKQQTSMLSNIGSIELEDKVRKYVNNILVVVMPNKLQQVKCTICSYQDKLNITINSNLHSQKLPRAFLRQLRANLRRIEVVSNK